MIRMLACCFGLRRNIGKSGIDSSCSMKLKPRDVPMGGVGAPRPPPNAHETAKKLVIKKIL